MLIDAHCHLDFSAFDGDREQVLRRAWDAGVGDAVVAGYGPAGWEGIAALCTGEKQQGRPGLWGVLGLHPWALAELCGEHGVEGVRQRLDGWMERLEALLQRPGIVGLGETGLDASAGAATAPMELQEEVYRRQIRLARKLGKPLVIHALRAVDRAAQLAAEEGARAGMVHSWSGSAEQLGPWLELGFCISFCGTISYVGAKKAARALAAVPEARLLLESDAPDQSPEPQRGERNEPAYLRWVLAAAARALGAEEGELGERCAANARALFGLVE